MAKLWKKGRGKLGPFQPLHGSWAAETESPMGRSAADEFWRRSWAAISCG